MKKEAKILIVLTILCLLSAGANYYVYSVYQDAFNLIVGIFCSVVAFFAAFVMIKVWND
jgi:hypothetical protein